MSVKGDVISFNSYRDPVFLKSRVCGNELCASGHGYVPGVADKKRGRTQKVCVFITAAPRCVCVYYCSTYYKAVRVGGGG